MKLQLLAMITMKRRGDSKNAGFVLLMYFGAKLVIPLLYPCLLSLVFDVSWNNNILIQKI